MVTFNPQPLYSQEKVPTLAIEQEDGWATFIGCCGEESWAAVIVGAVERRDGLLYMWVLWRGEMGCSAGAVERRYGL
jgi:hypothetical protein